MIEKFKYLSTIDKIKDKQTLEEFIKNKNNEGNNLFFAKIQKFLQNIVDSLDEKEISHEDWKKSIIFLNEHDLIEKFNTDAHSFLGGNLNTETEILGYKIFLFLEEISNKFDVKLLDSDIRYLEKSYVIADIKQQIDEIIANTQYLS